MVRAFLDQPLPRGALERILDAGRRAPTAGFAQGVEFLVLEGRDQTERYWSSTFTPSARQTFRWKGLFHAPALVVVAADASAYLVRYAEPDKASSGLGEGEDRWPVPFWLTDAAMAVQNMLLSVVDEGLGALYFGIFSGEEAVRATFGIPAASRLLGTVAIGTPDLAADEPGRSQGRLRVPLERIVHYGAW
jgi:nitroreductase